MIKANEHGIHINESMFWRILRLLRRNVAAFIANWLEQQGGFPLFTVEGDEPEPADLSWDLPRFINKVSSASWTSDNSSSVRVGGIPYSDVLDDDDNSVSATFKALLATKLFACLDLQESEELYNLTTRISLKQAELLFCTGDSSESGLFVVLEGTLDIFCQDGDQRVLTNTLSLGESVGDLDVVDGGLRSLTCIGRKYGGGG
eukprot:jgi/Botrbrau1/5699/Bobra.0071s0032.1